MLMMVNERVGKLDDLSTDMRRGPSLAYVRGIIPGGVRAGYDGATTPCPFVYVGWDVITREHASRPFICVRSPVCLLSKLCTKKYQFLTFYDELSPNYLCMYIRMEFRNGAEKKEKEERE